MRCIPEEVSALRSDIVVASCQKPCVVAIVVDWHGTSPDDEICAKEDDERKTEEGYDGRHDDSL